MHILWLPTEWRITTDYWLVHATCVCWGVSFCCRLPARSTAPSPATSPGPPHSSGLQHGHSFMNLHSRLTGGLHLWWSVMVSPSNLSDTPLFTTFIPSLSRSFHVQTVFKYFISLIIFSPSFSSTALSGYPLFISENIWMYKLNYFHVDQIHFERTTCCYLVVILHNL